MSNPVRIGLVDSGVAPALASHVVAARSFTGENLMPDRLGHGTRVARIILHYAADARLLDAQVFGARQVTSPAAVAAALDWLCGEGAQLVNLSLGLRTDRAVLRRAVDAALEAGLVLLASVPARGPQVYPGAYPGVLRISGDARCQPGQLATFGGEPADYGASPRALDGTLGGASFAVAHITGMLARELLSAGTGGTVRSLLDPLARYHGRERRLA